jgi:hypothetical protein
VRHALLGLPGVAAIALFLSASVAGQSAAPQRPDGVEPREVSRLFDAYAIMQAQEMLRLDDEKFAAFVPRLKTLHEARRRNMRARTQIIQDMQRLFRQTNADPDEAALKERLDALATQEASASAEIARATAAVDELLDVRQRARFRIFEHQLELKRLELLARIRQQNRAKRNRPDESR